MNHLIAQLSERRLHVHHEATALLDRAENQKREFTADEERQWKAYSAELDTLAARIQQLSDDEKRATAHDSFMANFRPGAARANDPSDAELRQFLGGEGRGMIEFPVGKRDLTKGTTTAGGFTVPTSFYNTLMEHLVSASAIRGAATILPTTSGEDLQMPATTSYSSAVLVAEAAALTESDPVFAQVTLKSYKYGCMIQASRELIDDSAIDLQGFLAREVGIALGVATGTAYATGTGSSQPKGLVTCATLGKTAAGAAAITMDELIDLQFSVNPLYRANGSYVINDTTASYVRKLKDTTNQYLWQPSVQAGQPDLLLGKPALIDPNIPAMTTGLKSVVFGDISRFFIRDAKGIRFERSDEYAFGNDLVTFRALMRTDSNLIDNTGAVKYLIQA